MTRDRYVTNFSPNLTPGYSDQTFNQLAQSINSVLIRKVGSLPVGSDC